MLTIIKGDLLKSDCDVIAHQVNCQSVMGSGIAKQIRKDYPDAYISFMDDKRKPKDKLGTFTRGINETDYAKALYCYNLYGQLYYGRFNVIYTDYEALKWAFFRMLQNVSEREHAIRKMMGGPPRMTPVYNKLKEGLPMKVGLNYGIGCGLAGGDWKLVEAILDDISDCHGREIFLYKL